MKTFVLVVCALTIVKAVYGFDPKVVARIRALEDECSKELNIPKEPPAGEVWACIGRKIGGFRYEEGILPSEDIILKTVEGLVSDPDDLKKATKILRDCFAKVKNAEGTIKERTMGLVVCGLPAVPFFDH